jgi:hypothetical protein
MPARAAAVARANEAKRGPNGRVDGSLVCWGDLPNACNNG